MLDKFYITEMRYYIYWIYWLHNGRRCHVPNLGCFVGRYSQNLPTVRTDADLPTNSTCV